MTVADLSIGPDDHFLDAPTQGRRKTRSSSGEKTTKAPVKEQISESRMLSNVIGFGSESDVESSSEGEEEKKRKRRRRKRRKRRRKRKKKRRKRKRTRSSYRNVQWIGHPEFPLHPQTHLKFQRLMLLCFVRELRKMRVFKRVSLFWSTTS